MSVVDLECMDIPLAITLASISGTSLGSIAWAVASVRRLAQRRRALRDAEGILSEIARTDGRAAAEAIAALMTGKLPDFSADPYPDDPHERRRINEGSRLLPSATERQ